MLKVAYKNEIVKKSNALIRGHWPIESVWEPRIVALLASRVTLQDEDFKVYQIPILELIGEEYGGRDYTEIATAVKNMMGRVIEIQDGLTKKIFYNVFSKCTIDTQKGICELCFHPDLKPHYLQLKERFTQYSLAEFMSLPSIYSQRLYEILQSWHNMTEVEIEIDNLHAMLDTSISLKKDFKDFRRRVLDQAHKDIMEREGSSLWFDWEPIKMGRGGKVVAIRFVFNQEKAKELIKNQVLPDQMFIHQQLQKQSNGCFERLHKQGKQCTPKLKTPKCKFCTTRGRMYAQQIVIESQILLPIETGKM
jgi:plasmid replication initiation protein